MTYAIKDDCISCDNCHPQCPRGAIKPNASNDGYWIDPTLCDNCEDVEVPRCVEACDNDALQPLTPKKGRLKSTLLPAAIPDIFLNGKTTPFASSMVIWEACNLLSQRQTLPWQADDDGRFMYSRSVHRGRGHLQFRLAYNAEAEHPEPMSVHDGTAAIAQFDIRSTCVHLIFASYLLTCDRPWEQSFTLNDQHIEQCLGLNKRKDLSKLEKLKLIKEMVHQACQILVSTDWPRQGKVKAFTLTEHSIWQLLDTQYYFAADSLGNRHLIGLQFTIRAGIWSQHFLNKHQYRRQQAFYQYGNLPQSLLSEVMSNWQQHEGAVRMMLWLLFKLRLGGDHRLTVRTLLRVAYGEERVHEAITVRGAHKRLLKTFESDLEAMHYYGLKPRFDPETFPPEIQPLWARVTDIPEDAEAALEFWANDANMADSLTQAAPRNKWQRLLNARLLGFEGTDEWQQNTRRSTTTRQRRQPASPPTPTADLVSGSRVKTARQRLNLSQRALADRLGKSQSWIRDIENGRFQVSADDQIRLHEVLELSCFS
jgi:DNA-binding transcriptional regulator YiaG/NAD-dependent dihydropyrimidine dehydrogenase PreA subunit